LASLVERRGFTVVHVSSGVSWEVQGVPEQAIAAFTGRRRQHAPPGPARRREPPKSRAMATRYLVRPEYDPAIFCEEVRAEPVDEDDREADEAGYLWCRCYSTRCPEGEMGHVHPDAAIELTHDEFALARATHWRPDSSSRHTFDTEPAMAYWQVGWDQPTMTFFAQLYRVGDEDEPRRWIGPRRYCPRSPESRRGYQYICSGPRPPRPRIRRSWRTCGLVPTCRSTR
jgi:hypothetical protein